MITSPGWLNRYVTLNNADFDLDMYDRISFGYGDDLYETDLVYYPQYRDTNEHPENYLIRAGAYARTDACGLVAAASGFIFRERNETVVTDVAGPYITIKVLTGAKFEEGDKVEVTKIS